MMKIVLPGLAMIVFLLNCDLPAIGKSPVVTFPNNLLEFPVSIVNHSRFLFHPIGNDTDTLGAFVLQDETQSTIQREFLSVFGLVVDVGTAARDLSGKADKVAIYAAVDCKTSGGGACWSQNLLVNIRDGYAASGSYGATDVEMDLNNNDVATGEADGAAGLGLPGYTAMSISGVGTKRSTAALLIGGPGDHTLFNRGLVFANNSIQQSSIADYGVSKISVDIRGQHETGVDTHLMTGGADFLAANGNGLFFMKADKTNAFQGIVSGIDDSVVIGAGSTAIYAMQNITPGIDFASLGTTKRTWHEAHIATVHARSFHGMLRTPSSSFASCDAGEFADDADFHYVCVGANHWKRVALVDF